MGTKEAIAKAAAASKKGGKKKWSKGKVKDKLNNSVFLTEATMKAINKDIPNTGLITISHISDKYKIIGGLAKKIIRHFLSEGVIVPVGTQHSSLMLYSGKAYLDKRNQKE